MEHVLPSLFVPLPHSQFTFSGIQFSPSSDSGSMFPERMPFKRSFSLDIFLLRFIVQTPDSGASENRLKTLPVLRYKLIWLNTETRSLQGKGSSEKISPSAKQLSQ